MDDYAKSLLTKRTQDMSEDEIKRITHITAHAKRLIDVLCQIPGARDEFEQNPEEFLTKYKIDLTVEDANFLMNPDDPDEKLRIIKSEDLDKMPESFFRYRQFYANKLQVRNLMINKYCVPSNEKLKVWRERQMKRCDGALGGLNKSFIHTMLTMELADGCSVGCEFCGLNAGRLKSLFRYTDENAELFKGVIKKCHEIIGDAAGMGMLYFATEPLDNPDYELFEKDFWTEFGVIPQITTAVCDRDIERTRKFVQEISGGAGFIHRFTIRSEEMARKVLDYFAAEELLSVELLPQYPLAPSFVPYTKVGKLYDKEDGNVNKTGGEDKAVNAGEHNADPGTIVCVDGFAINFVRKTLTIFTPCHVNDKYPKGISEAACVAFKDAEDFGDKLNELIDKYVVLDLPKDEVLSIYDYYSKRIINGKKYLYSTAGYALAILNDYMEATIDMLLEGKYKRNEIVDGVCDKVGTNPENVYWSLNNLWKQGVIRDTKFF